MMIDSMQPADWDAVAAIYAEGIATGNATFETTVPTWDHWNAVHRPDCRLVMRDDERILGWAALSPVSARQVYTGVAEVTIYIAATARGQGIGKRLLIALVEASENAGVWTLQAGIFRKNTASIALHTACGFRTVGTRERLGQLNSVWHDVVLMERRSKKVGI